jgi:hypothetical protein
MVVRMNPNVGSQKGICRTCATSSAASHDQESCSSEVRYGSVFLQLRSIRVSLSLPTQEKMWDSFCGEVFKSWKI